MPITENSIVYSAIVYGAIAIMLTVVMTFTVKVLKREGTRPEDDHL
ncbi:MAG: hypothetical protein RML40_04740 [Bacteroidota bacterium]|nr:hypothetical protein [Candidatus Kapabacteria bacterium]MDW8219818.1 hypothetical protein [Bacteroidota bacterium]